MEDNLSFLTAPRGNFGYTYHIIYAFWKKHKPQSQVGVQIRSLCAKFIFSLLKIGRKYLRIPLKCTLAGGTISRRLEWRLSMRVITGSARGRRLKELEGMETRPTTGRVKEGLFSALQFDIEGRRVLDLFAGTGQLGIEALSRGAASAVFVDRRADALALVRENLALTGLQDRAKVVSGDGPEFLRACRERFDIIFLDPPYAAGLLEPALALIQERDLLAPYGSAAAEHPAAMNLPGLAPPYGVYRTYRYGKIGLTIYHRAGDGKGGESGL